ncbi:hypothetical protein [Thiohalophilus sp.]|nr:hypothetical protein [Thiohalophilus sp.]MDZ7663301.1 hypothetical protein [Thiohalophilus sp.]
MIRSGFVRTAISGLTLLSMSVLFAGIADAMNAEVDMGYRAMMMQVSYQW